MYSSTAYPSRWTAFWLALAAVLFVFGWRLCVVISQSTLLATATAVGSVPQFRGRLFPNEDGTALVFSRETENGIGTYYYNTDSSKAKLLFDQMENGYQSQFGMLAWSPDSHYFACAVISTNNRNPKKDIVIYSGNTGEPTSKIEIEGFLWDSQFIWLSPHSLAYSTYNHNWIVVEQRPAGNWETRESSNDLRRAI